MVSITWFVCIYVSQLQCIEYCLLIVNAHWILIGKENNQPEAVTLVCGTVSDLHPPYARWQLRKVNQVSAVVSLVCVWRQLSIIASLCLLRRKSWRRLWFSSRWQGGCSCSDGAKVLCSTSACDVFVFTYRGVMGDTCLFWSVSEVMSWRIRIYFGLYLSWYNGNTYLFRSVPEVTL